MDHRLTFRGLLTEGLGDNSNEAAASPIRRVGSDGELGLWPRESLSWAAWSLSNVGDAARGTAAASRFASDLLGCAAATGRGQGFFGRGISAVGRRTVLFAPPAWGPWPAPMPALLAPLAAAASSNNALGECSRSHIDPTPSLAGQPPGVVVSRPWEHGSF